MDKPPNLDDWTEIAKRELKADPETLNHVSADGLSIKPLYTAADLTTVTHMGSLPGITPFVRGARATMYAGRSWTIRQYAGFSTAEESNLFYNKALAAGQKGLSVAFDLATHRGFDSDHPSVAADVGKAGVAIDSVEDMKLLFTKIPLQDISVSMTMNGAVIPVLASFIVAAEEQGCDRRALSGTIQNDILKEFMVRNTYIYPPEPSMRIVADIIEFAAKEMPKFNSVSISGYHMQEAGATLVQELAFTLADGREYVRAALARGLDIDDFAGRLSFFFAIGMNFFAESAKLRAARLLWSKVMEEFGPKRAESSMLRTHCQTSGVSLQERDPYNNIVRTAFEAMSAVLGSTQSLHTNSFDEAIALPTEFAARIARNTQLILLHETGITDVIDPLAGSYYVESLTQQLADQAWALMQEIETRGGMTKVVASGWPKQLIEEAALRKQTAIDANETIIVGVNKYELEQEEAIETREIDNASVRLQQMARLALLKQNRNTETVNLKLAALKECAAGGRGNLLAVAIEAARARATIGEISETMREVFGTHEAASPLVKGLYNEINASDPIYKTLQERIEAYVAHHNHPPRILIAKLGQDGHDRGARVIASAFSDLGFEITTGPLFQTPDEAAALAIKSHAQIIGVSSLAAVHKTLVPELLQTLEQLGRKDILVVCGGVIPRTDHAFLKQNGVAAIFGPATNLMTAMQSILDLLDGTKRNS